MCAVHGGGPAKHGASVRVAQRVGAPEPPVRDEAEEVLDERGALVPLDGEKHRVGVEPPRAGAGFVVGGPQHVTHEGRPGAVVGEAPVVGLEGLLDHGLPIAAGVDPHVLPITHHPVGVALSREAPLVTHREGLSIEPRPVPAGGPWRVLSGDEQHPAAGAPLRPEHAVRLFPARFGDHRDVGQHARPHDDIPVAEARCHQTIAAPDHAPIGSGGIRRRGWMRRASRHRRGPLHRAPRFCLYARKCL